MNAHQHRGLEERGRAPAGSAGFSGSSDRHAPRLVGKESRVEVVSVSVSRRSVTRPVGPRPRLRPGAHLEQLRAP
jgi:hypothetical protein